MTRTEGPIERNDARGRDLAATAAAAGTAGGPGVNIGYEAVDRQVAEGRGDHTALRWLPRAGDPIAVTYGQLLDRTNRFARALDDLGVGAGARVGLLLGRRPELHVAALGTWRHRSVVCPLFAAFGPEPVRERLTIAGASALVTTAELYERRVAPVRAQLPSLRHVLLVDATDPEVASIDGAVNLEALLERSAPDWTVPATDPEDLATLHFTSGTTGRPKAAMHVHAAVDVHRRTAELALGLRADDIYWCTADPGWVTGTSYGIIAPLTIGATALVDEGEFNVDRWYAVLDEQRVTVWYTAPTALRMLRRAGPEAAQRSDHSALRTVASVGEPLDADTVLWTDQAWGCPVHDGWWQTETGGIMIANRADEPVVPGSMGRPLPGVVATVIERDEDGEGEPLVVDGVAVEAAPGTVGHLALRPGGPSMFRGYLGEPERYDACFEGGWYITGDLARRDPDDNYWFVGRADDVIKTAGHLVGPAEIETVLRGHPDVAEAAVVGLPHPVAGTIIKAFVTLAPDTPDRADLPASVIGWARTRLGPALAPREVEVVASIPVTRSGKILRRLLRARALGLPQGDVSTVEPTPDPTRRADDLRGAR